MSLFDKREKVDHNVQGQLLYRVPLAHKAEVTILRQPWGWDAILWDEDGNSVEHEKDLMTVIEAVRFIKHCDEVVAESYEPMLPVFAPEWKLSF